MKEEFKQYILSLYQDIPTYVYEGLLSVFCLGVVLFVAWKGIKTGLRYSAILLLVEYIFLLFCSTVIFRSYNESQGHDFHPFWSYKAIQEGRAELLPENIMNVVVFVPVGILLGSLLRVKGSWLIALLIGLGISVSIEAMQFFFHRGFAETDDVMHNTLGCLLGFMVYGGWFMFKNIIKTKNNVRKKENLPVLGSYERGGTGAEVHQRSF